MTNEEELEELEFQLRMSREDSDRLTDLVEKTIALLADSGDEAASFAMYCRLCPLASEQEWSECVGRDAQLRHPWRSLLGSPKASFAGW